MVLVRAREKTIIKLNNNKREGGKKREKKAGGCDENKNMTTMTFDYSYEATVSTSISAEAVCAIALQAGDAIMEVYNESAENGKGDVLVRQKSDKSPLTRADLAANDIIVKSLASLYPHIPIVSEEQSKSEQSYEEFRKRYKCFFCVDPLDGTKEFIKRNGQFTVNIALVEGKIFM